MSLLTGLSGRSPAGSIKAETQVLYPHLQNFLKVSPGNTVQPLEFPLRGHGPMAPSGPSSIQPYYTHSLISSDPLFLHNKTTGHLTCHMDRHKSLWGLAMFTFLSLRSSVHSPGSFALVIPGWTSSSLLRSFLLGWPSTLLGVMNSGRQKWGGDHWGKHLISR